MTLPFPFGKTSNTSPPLNRIDLGLLVQAVPSLSSTHTDRTSDRANPSSSRRDAHRKARGRLLPRLHRRRWFDPIHDSALDRRATKYRVVIRDEEPDPSLRPMHYRGRFYLLRTYERPCILHSFEMKRRRMHLFNLYTRQKLVKRVADCITHGFSSLLVRGHVFIVGGYMKKIRGLNNRSTIVDIHGKTFSVQIDQRSLQVGSTVERASLRYPRFYNSLVAPTPDYIYCVGGKREGGYSDRCEIFNVAGDVWRELSPLNQPKAKIGLATFDVRFIYAFGGELPGTGLAKIERLDTCDSEQGWTIVPLQTDSGFLSLQSMGCIQFSNATILLCGGDIGKGFENYVKDVNIFDCVSGRHKCVGKMKNRNAFYYGRRLLRFNGYIYSPGFDVADVFSAWARDWRVQHTGSPIVVLRPSAWNATTQVAGQGRAETPEPRFGLENVLLPRGRPKDSSTESCAMQTQ